MINDITSKLPLFKEYRSLFPKAYELEEPLQELYQDYVNFCIDSFLFFRSKRWGRALQFCFSSLSNFLVVVFRKLAFGGMKTQFQLIEESITRNTAHFNTRVDIARTRLGVSANEHILRLTNMNINHNPLVKGIPFQQNSRFMGRDHVLDKLHRCLKS